MYFIDIQKRLTFTGRAHVICLAIMHDQRLLSGHTFYYYHHHHHHYYYYYYYHHHHYYYHYYLEFKVSCPFIYIYIHWYIVPLDLELRIVLCISQIPLVK